MDFLKEIEENFDKLGGRQLAAFYTQKIDDFLSEIFNSIQSPKPIALIATGGYGRAELAPYSDIDIMFFAEDKTDSKKVESVLYKLWDAGLMIGHCFRTADECIAEAKKDLRTHTSLLEARFIAGDRELYNYFHKKVYPELAYRKQKNFISGKLKEREKRLRDFGGSVFLLEPNVKEGQGGLRDIHTVLWLSRIALKINNIEGISDVISRNDFKRLIKAYDFLLKVRFCLHLINGRRDDALSFRVQDYVSKKMGFNDSKKFSGSERFMRYFYLKASTVKEITSTISGMCLRQWLITGNRGAARKKKITDNFILYKGMIIPSEKDILKNNPVSIIEAFYAFSKTGGYFSHALREGIKYNLLLIGKKVRNSYRAVLFFLEIFKGSRVYETLREMHETGVLERFIPEFGALKSLVIHEPFHRYTVDEHTMLAIRHLENLTATKYKNLEHLAGIMKNIKEREILFMALLFHDIGKAAGRYHEDEGYKRLKNIVERFNIDIEKRRRIEFLVRNHILMSVFALKREIEDSEVIAQFADAAGDEESLMALCLMTYADMSAVNPDFWTEWKAYLLKGLYEKTLNHLRGIRKDPAAYIETVLSSCADDDREGLSGFLNEMPERYLLSTPPEKIQEDYRLACGVRKDGFAVAISEKSRGITEIAIGALDMPGLFSQIVGVLSSKWLNIVSARLYTGKNGLVIDKIQISNWKELWWNGMEGVIKDGLKGAVTGVGSIELHSTPKEVNGKFDVFVELDNETSEESTIVEFFSQDRHGLLYDVSNLMHESGLNIISARVNTESGIAQDIFYVQHGGKKVNGPMAVKLLESLWENLK
ncbi:MAG: [protein-PII] uridylyltransferase [Thermodesulfovibrionales bacterium]|nr:[protein-PII] uridylyltransferase [Thermodesulfovibrionales bacterium]